MNTNLKSGLLPLITIIIATYNELLNIQKTLDSIYHQKYINIEIIVIDGDSDDGTVDILDDNSGVNPFPESEYSIDILSFSSVIIILISLFIISENACKIELLIRFITIWDKEPG